MASASSKARVERVVLDTSLFVNPEVRVHLGRTPAEAMRNFCTYARDLPSVEFYMPPSVFEELMNFVGRGDISGEFLLHVNLKSPAKYGMAVPALFFYEYIEEMRERINRGLRAGESAVRAASQGRASDEIIRDLRRKHREALREGVIDSKEDVDLILLAHELDALFVTADQGAAKWADKLGVRTLLPEKFKDYLLAALALAGGGRETPERT